MKTLAELQAIKERTLKNMTARSDSEDNIRIVVGMATCGIAAGARTVMNAFTQEIAKRSLKGVTVTQTGCVGMCRYEPIVEVLVPGEEKVTYIMVTEEKVARIVNDHIVNGNVVSEYTIGSVTE